jgi:uncharacterized membrane protein
VTTFNQIMLLVLAGIAIFFLYRTIKNQPGLFTKEKFSQTASTLGILALALIIFVAFLVMMVRA